MQMPDERQQYFAQTRILRAGNGFEDRVCNHCLIFYDHSNATSFYKRSFGRARRNRQSVASARLQWPAARSAAALLSTIRASTATPVLVLIRNGLTSIEAMREPASAIRLDIPTSAFTAEASCSAGLPR